MQNSPVHVGVDPHNPDLASWNPVLRSPDSEILPDWNDSVARTRDLVRNHGIASGAVQTHLDNVIGTGLRLSAKPDYKALGLSEEWADEWSREVEGRWRLWANDIDCYCDASRRLNFSGLLAQAYRSYLESAEITATLEWLPRRPDRYATAVQMIQPDRLSNPHGVQDTAALRGGVAQNRYGEPLAYFIRQAHESEAGLLGESERAYTWVRVPATVGPTGRRMFIHIYDMQQPGQSRGRVGFVSVLAKMRVFDRFERATLHAAILNAMFATVIESELPSYDVADALGGDNVMDGYVQAKKKWAKANGGASWDGASITHLLPNEKLRMLAAEHPSANYSEFESSTLRQIAAGLNLSYEQLSRDYSKTNYSSAQAAMLEAWKFFSGRRHHVASRFATQVYAAWLEEAIDRGDVKLPPQAPDFVTAKSAWCGAEWIGTPRGQIDDLKSNQARRIKYAMHTTTLEQLCAEQQMDWRDVLDQRAREERYMRQIGLDPMKLLAEANRKGEPSPGTGVATDPDGKDES